ncbi:MAG: hypothetical protein L3J84_12295 [Gammaproteobacteria bacterium]|nr:hypothetical protein [Gammaproteobacteria bacterium]
MTQDIQHQVDQLLLEQGEYLPLEFLLQEGRLLYADYEAWRNGEFDYLDETLFGDPEHIKQQLMQAADYLQRRGWKTETVTYHSWSDNSTQALRFSQNNALNQCFLQRYHKPEDQPQMDLFTDAPATSLFNGITQALIDRNPAEARRLLEQLYDTTPDHVRLGELEQLVEAAEDLNTPSEDVATDMQMLQQTLIPLAKSLLGKNSRNLLIPLWRRLSAALQNQPYQSAKPTLHLSYTASQSMDWETVCRAVENESYWHTDAALLLRHARACEYLHQKPEALLSWFKLCWQFPEQCDIYASSNDHELRQQWIHFLELDPEIPAQTFPAWLLLAKPGLIQQLPEPEPMSKVACPASYITLYQLQQERMQSHAESGSDNTMAMRTQLKQQDPELFQHFLSNI